MTTPSCTIDQPFRVETTNLTNGNVKIEYPLTKEDALKILTSVNEGEEFVAVWDRQTQDVIDTSHKDIDVC